MSPENKRLEEKIYTLNNSRVSRLFCMKEITTYLLLIHKIKGQRRIRFSFIQPKPNLPIFYRKNILASSLNMRGEKLKFQFVVKTFLLIAPCFRFFFLNKNNLSSWQCIVNCIHHISSLFSFFFYKRSKINKQQRKCQKCFCSACVNVHCSLVITWVVVMRTKETFTHTHTHTREHGEQRQKLYSRVNNKNCRVALGENTISKQHSLSKEPSLCNHLCSHHFHECPAIRAY